MQNNKSTDDNQISTGELLFKIVFWILVAVAAWFIGKWIWHVAVSIYYWIVDLINTIWNICLWVVGAAIGLYAYKWFIAPIMGWFNNDVFHVNEDPKARYTRSNWSTSDNQRFNKRVWDSSRGGYHTITTNRYGGDARDEFGRSGILHGSEFHRH